MFNVRRDLSSKRRISSVIKLTNNIGKFVSLFMYPVLVVMGIYSLTSLSINQWYSITLIALGVLWTIETIWFIFSEHIPTPNAESNNKSIWSNEKKWLLILIISLNILFIFIGYSAIQRRIFNNLI